MLVLRRRLILDPIFCTSYTPIRRSMSSASRLLTSTNRYFVIKDIKKFFILGVEASSSTASPSEPFINVGWLFTHGFQNSNITCLTAFTLVFGIARPSKCLPCIVLWHITGISTRLFLIRQFLGQVFGEAPPTLHFFETV